MSADTFQRDLARFTAKIERATRRTFVDATAEVQRSVVEGSEITGAPGQPVDTGYLKSSFIGEFVSPTAWQLTTNVNYAPAIEDNDRSAFDPAGRPNPTPPTPGAGTQQTSTVGGHHSVKLTRAGWQKIVDHVTPRAA